jgi:hypothetical protein
MSNLALLIGGCLSALGVGWGIGRTIKMFRQFFDVI